MASAAALAALPALGCGGGGGDDDHGRRRPPPNDGRRDDRRAAATADRRRSATARAACGSRSSASSTSRSTSPSRHGRRRAPLRGRAVRRDPAGADGGGEPTPFLDIADLITCGGEQGLLSVAFDPDYEQSGPALRQLHRPRRRLARSVEYRRSADDPAAADPDSARELIVIDDFAANHNGGLLLFGPDGELYLGMGDGGGAGDPERTAQDPDSPLGKLLRIDRENAGEYEVAALGLRNPWRFSFDSRDRRPVDRRRRPGRARGDRRRDPRAVRATAEPLNFGWSAFEGTEPLQRGPGGAGRDPARLEYGRDGGCSVTGGYVVRDPELDSLYGRYLYGDFCEGELRSFTADPSRAGARRPRARPAGRAAELVRRGRRRAASTRSRSTARSTGSSPTADSARGARSVAGRRARRLRGAAAALGGAAASRARPARPSRSGLEAAADRPIRPADATSPRRPGEPRTALRRRAAGPGDRRRATGRKLGPAVPRHHRPGALRPRRGAPRGGRAVLDRLRPRLRRQPALLRLLHRPPRQQLRRRATAARAARRCARRRELARARCSRSAIPGPTPITAASCSSAPTATSGSRPVTAAAAATSTTRRAASGRMLGKLLRVDPRARQRGFRRRPDNPLLGSAGPRRGLRLGPAQPVAVLLRPAHRQPGRSPTSATTGGARGDQLPRRRRPAAGRQLRLARVRGLPPRRSGASRARAAGDADRPATATARTLRDHRRLRRPRPGACPSSTAATSTPTSAAGGSAASAPPPLVDGVSPPPGGSPTTATRASTSAT